MNHTSSGIVDAVLVAGTFETPYRRAGRGPSVLLLAQGTGLLEALAGELRIFEPLRVPAEPGAPEWIAWLHGLLDGLGLERPAVVVDAGGAEPVRQLAAAAPDRLGPVVEASSPAEVRALLLGGNEIIDV